VETPDGERRGLAPTLRTYVTLWGGEMNRSRFLYQPELEILGQEHSLKRGGLLRF
jgi:hypothetical protein